MSTEAIKAFYSRLAAIAKLCAFELDDDVIALYERALEGIGYQRLVRALDELVVELRPGMPFPSIAAIRKAATGELPPSEQRSADDAEARTAATLVLGAVSKFGAINGSGPSAIEKGERIRAYVGDLGWACIDMRGGWNFICQTVSNENLTTFEAQLRELARSKLDRRRRGVDDLPPALPPTGERHRGLRAVSAGEAADFLPDHLRAKLKPSES